MTDAQKKIFDAFIKAGWHAHYCARKGTVSLHGGKSVPLAIGVAKMEKALECILR